LIISHKFFFTPKQNKKKEKKKKKKTRFLALKVNINHTKYKIKTQSSSLIGRVHMLVLEYASLSRNI
jgi:hypothetical protein